MLVSDDRFCSKQLLPVYDTSDLLPLSTLMQAGIRSNHNNSGGCECFKALLGNGENWGLESTTRRNLGLKD